MSAFSLLKSYLMQTIKSGQLTLIDANGKSHVFGHPGDRQELRQVTVEITKPSLYWRLVLMPDPAAGEAFMDGTLKIHQGTIFDLFAILADQKDIEKRSRWNRINFAKLERIKPNRIGIAKQNVAHHYDLNRQLFELFLDEDLQYSCAYFPEGVDTLEDAQKAKLDMICRKLRLSPGDTFLDIGCGWGGRFVMRQKIIASRLVGGTLSQDQHDFARETIVRQGLEGAG